MAFLYVEILCGLKHFHMELSIFLGNHSLLWVPSAVQVYCYMYEILVFSCLPVFPSSLASGFIFCVRPSVCTVLGHNKT